MHVSVIGKDMSAVLSHYRQDRGSQTGSARCLLML